MLESRLTASERLCSLLRSDHDLPISELANRLRAMGKLRRIRSNIDGLSKSLDFLHWHDEIRDRDLSDLRSKADGPSGS